MQKREKKPTATDKQSAATPTSETLGHGSTAKSGRLCGKHLLALVPILLGLVIYNISTILEELEATYGYGERSMYDQVSPAIMQEFHKYDVDSSGFIDPMEFISIAMDMNVDVNLTTDKFEFFDSEMDNGKDVLLIKAEFTPLIISTMTKFEKKDSYMFGSPGKLLPGLTKWKEPQHPLQTYGAQNFKVFLPLIGQSPFAEPYYVIDAELFGRKPHMSYYHPYKPRGKEEFLHAMLSQFHSNIFVNCRFGPRGTLAVVRAENSVYYDIVIRSHVEFQLNEEPSYPFWFTPAQFSGRLIITKDGSHVEYFEMHVPTNRSLNVDMEWVTGPNGNEVDIGYMPLMRIYAVSPSIVFNSSGDLNFVIPPEPPQSELQQFMWDREITLQKATDMLERTMYPFKQIPYLDFLDAFALAKKEKKLVHSILLWGALDDQSC